MSLRSPAGVALLLALLTVAAPVATATTGIASQPAAGPPGSNASDATHVTAADGENATAWNVTVWRAPGSAMDRIDDREAIARAQRTGTLIRNETVAVSDALVLEMELSGLDARLANVTGSNATVRFIRATNGTDSSIRLVQTNPTAEIPEKIVGLHRAGAMTVVPDRATDTYYLVVDLAAARVGFKDYGTPDSPDRVDWNPRLAPDVERGDRYAVNVTIDNRTRVFETDPDRYGSEPVLHVVDSTTRFGRAVTLENATVWTAPHSVTARLDDPAAVGAARRTGNLTRDGTVALSDTLVLSLVVDGLADRMAAVAGENETIRFVRATNGTASAIRLVQTNPTVERPAKVGRLTHPGAMTVVADSATDTYHLLVDVSRLPVDYGGNWEYAADADVRQGDQFALNVTLDGRSTVFEADPDGFADPIVQVVAPEIAFGRTAMLDRLVLRASASQPIQARTGLAPGTPVVVRIENRSDGGPPIVRRTRVIETTTGTVGSDRFDPATHEIVTTIDTSGVAPNTTFDARIVADGRTDAERRGVVRRTDASVAMPATESWRDGRINVTSASLSEGGFLVAQAGDRQDLSDPDGILYRGHVHVDPGTHRNVTIPVETWGIFRLSAPLPESVTVVAVRDANQNGEYDEGDLPYVANGTAVAGVASIPDPRPAPEDVPEDMFTDTPTPTFTPRSTTAPTTATPTTSLPGATATPPTTRTAETTAGTGDGFGVASAVLALLSVLATMLLARRRE